VTEPMPLPFVICLIGFGAFQVAAFLICAIWIPRFVVGHGGHTAGFPPHLLIGSGWLRDYREAQAIRRRIGHTPWFLRTFEVLQVLAVLFFIAGIASTVLTP
jgi:hypothetical protein